VGIFAVTVTAAEALSFAGLESLPADTVAVLVTVPTTIVALAVPGIDERRVSQPKGAVLQERDAGGRHINCASGVNGRDCESATALYVIAPL